MDPVGAVALLPFRAKQIRYLNIVSIHFERREDTWNFSRFDSGPLPLLCTLRIAVIEVISLDSPETTIPPFGSAVNL